MEPASWERAKQIIGEAMTLPPGEREAFVRRTCSETPELCQEILPLLDDPEFPTRECSGAEEPDRDRREDLVPGSRVGPYVIVDRIGQGGMGQVFLATDPELRRRVALKCLLPTDGSSGLDRARILNEAIAAAAISHPNVATVHHVVEHADRAFIVMEYVEGESLATKLRRERLTLDRLLDIARQLASGLRAAHEKGVIHRDIKPGNVQIALDGSVKVLDFGVARAVRMMTAPSEAPTTVGRRSPPAPAIVARGGTPAYMSPEQLAGRPVDERSDLYSFGVVLFEMAVGHRPYWANESESALADGQRRGALRADAIQPDVPRALADVIEQALSMAPNARYQSAAEMEAAIDRLRVELLERPEGRRSFARRWLTCAALVALVVPTLALIGFLTTLGFNRTFGRTGAFGSETWWSYVRWGMLAVFPSAVIMTLTALIVLAARFALRTLELADPIGPTMDAFRRQGRRVAFKLGLNGPAGLAQALTFLGVATLLVLYGMNRPLINAWGSFFNTAPIETLMPMSESTFARLSYNVELEIAMLAFGFGLFKVIQLRNRTRGKEGLGSTLLLAGVVVLLILMRQLPYRTLTQRDFERIEISGDRCYIIGQTGDELLVLCPRRDPPRNRTIKVKDPSIRRTGVIENVFRGVSAPLPGQ